MFSQASFTRCLRPLVAKSHYGSCCSLLSLIDLTYPTCLSFYWFQSFLRLNSNNQLRDFTRRHFILPHFHPLQSGLKEVREEGKKEGGGLQDSGESYFCHTCNAFLLTVGMKRKSITRVFSRPTEFLCFCVGVDDILETM